jgi:chemotaxis protein methyltransferase CheR
MVEINDKEFRKLADHIKSNYGIHLKEEKKTLVMGRLSSILEKNNFKSFSEYYDYVVADKSGEAAKTLVNKINNKLHVFHEGADHFKFFKESALPNVENQIRDRDLRVWCAGCSTGQESYTLAFLIDEFFRDKNYWDTKLLATDLSERALDVARAGVYDENQITDIPKTWKTGYFTKTGQTSYAVANRIKQQIVFRPYNLITGSFKFKKKFHVIFCRNVMIYFDTKTKDELINRFYDITEPGGYLFIGHTESINYQKAKYRYVMPAVYRKPF